ncbi:TYK2 kinase, partial [Poecile atricapillus]|nr:TYK2 kinase [Poecile atricapillus]
EDFVFAKLRREEPEEGLYILRWSVLDFNRIILSVLKRSHQQVRPPFPARNSRDSPAPGTTPELQLLPRLFQAPGTPGAFKYRQFRIQRKGDSFVLEGWDREFPSLRELLDVLKGCTLKSGQENFTVKRCCPPKPGEISDLLIVRRAKEEGKQILNLTQLSFHQIRKNEIVQVRRFSRFSQRSHLGQGTRTNIYEGILSVCGNSGNDEEDFSAEQNNNNGREMRVVLKVLDPSHRDIALVSPGNAIPGIRGIQERDPEVEFGSERAGMRIQGLEFGSRGLKMDPRVGIWLQKGWDEAPGALHRRPQAHKSILNEHLIPSLSERVDRIPWIAPECIRDIGNLSTASDKWSFGTTLLEICFDADVPLKERTPSEKERFYEKRHRLPEPSCRELASLISRCLNYSPGERPSFRAVLRELTRLQPQHLVDVSSVNPDFPVSDPTVFQKRYLKKIRELGE